MPERRTKNSVPAAKPDTKARSVSIDDLRNIVAPASGKSEVVTLRLSGTWHTIWEELRKELPGIADAEILRQAIALRAALIAVDSKGERPEVTITYHDQTGKKVTVPLLEHVGIKVK